MLTLSVCGSRRMLVKERLSGTSTGDWPWGGWTDSEARAPRG